MAHVERERITGMLKANVKVLRIVSNKFGQRHTVRVQGFDGTSKSRHPDVSFVQLISSGVSHSQDIPRNA